MARAGIASLTTRQGVLWRRKVKLVNRKLLCSSDLTRLHSKLAVVDKPAAKFLDCDENYWVVICLTLLCLTQSEDILWCCWCWRCSSDNCCIRITHLWLEPAMSSENKLIFSLNWKWQFAETCWCNQPQPNTITSFRFQLRYLQNYSPNSAVIRKLCAVLTNLTVAG